MNSPSSYQLKLAQYLKSGLSPKTLKKIESMPDPLETGRFLYNAGHYKTLLKFSIDNLKKNKQVPWPFVMKTLTDHNITLSKEAAKILLESLLPKYKEKHPWLSACREWEKISHEFQALIQSQRKISQESFPDTKPTIQTDITVESKQHTKQMNDSTVPNIKTTAKTNIIPETDNPSEQMDNSTLYTKEAKQPDTAPATQQSNPAEVVAPPAPDTKTTEKTSEAEDPAVVLLDSPFTKVNTQENIISDPDTQSSQTNYSLQITNKTELPNITLDFNQHSKQMNNAIPIIEETEPTENSILYKREKTQPDITPDLDEQQLLKQLEFVQAKGLIEEEKKITAILLKKNPKNTSNWIEN